MEKADAQLSVGSVFDEGPDLNTKLARLRTFQASERTLMAWIRTAISMISFGFTIVKFFEYLESERRYQFRVLGSGGIGLVLILGGILALLVGILQYRKTTSMQGLRDKSVFWSFAVYVAFGTALIGVMAFISIFMSD
jgi:putative membrane protein